MGLLDDLLGNAVPGGKVSKPLMLALLGLLTSGAAREAWRGAPACGRGWQPARRFGR